MTHLQKLRTGSYMKWVFSNFAENCLRSISIIQHPRFYGKKNVDETGKGGNLNKRVGSGEAEDLNEKVSVSVCVSAAHMSAAKKALQEYLYSTRNLHFLDAELMSMNSPHFVRNLLRKVENEEDVGRSIRRFLRYHPVNEFELFFESLGLKPSEYATFLPRNMLYLSDAGRLLDNYHILCNYGVEPKRMGKIFVEAREIFEYDSSVLQSKLRAYEELGLNQSIVAKVIACSPYLFTGDVNAKFVKLLDKLKSLGIEFSVMEGPLSNGDSYDWAQMHGLLCLFSKTGCSKKRLCGIISRQPKLLFEGSGNWTVLLFGFLLKLGCTMNQIHLFFLKFPQIDVEKFLSNLRHCFLFLNAIEMDSEDIRKIFLSHPQMVGSVECKETTRLLRELRSRKKRLCSYIKKNPLELKNWVSRSTLLPLPESKEEKISGRQKAKFLMALGFEVNSIKMKGQFERSKYEDLKERFDCIVEAGLDPKDVALMVRRYPELLLRSKDSTQEKIDYLVNILGYPISSVLSFPLYLRLSTQRVKLRMSMYNWLKDQGAVNPMLSLGTLLGTSDKCFLEWFVTRRPGGLEVWEDLKKQIYLK